MSLFGLLHWFYEKLKMFPTSSMKNVSNGSFIDLEHFRELYLGVFASVMKIYQFPHFFLFQYRSTVSLSTISSSVSNFISFVFGWRSPTKILQIVVPPVSVQVAADFSSRPGTNKSSQNKSMDKVGLILISSGVLPQTHIQVSPLAIRNLLQDPLRNFANNPSSGGYCSSNRFDSTTIRYHVSTNVANNPLPDFFFGPFAEDGGFSRIERHGPTPNRVVKAEDRMTCSSSSALNYTFLSDFSKVQKGSLCNN